MGLRGPKAKSAAWHLARGSYRRDRHGPKPAPADLARDAAWRDDLALPGGPPAPPRALDPLEELLERLPDEKPGRA